MLHGLDALDEDPGTKVIVLVSKPPAAEVAEQVLGRGRRDRQAGRRDLPRRRTRRRCSARASSRRPASPRPPTWRSRSPRASTPHAGADRDRRTARSRSREAARGDGAEPAVRARHLLRRDVLLRGAADPAATRASRPRRTRRPRATADSPTSRSAPGNTIIDMGDDEFTQGRPHPMIDPSLRDARVRDEVADPTTAVVLFDVVLGYGSADDPIGEPGRRDRHAPAPRHAARAGTSPSSRYVCGTDQDPQDRDQVVAGTRRPPACSSPGSNAEAATWAAAVVTARQGAAA